MIKNRLLIENLVRIKWEAETYNTKGKKNHTIRHQHIPKTLDNHQLVQVKLSEILQSKKQLQRDP